MQHREADPFIEAYAPTKFFKPTATPEQVELSDLELTINYAHVDEAIIVYNLLEMKEGVEIPIELKHKFLEFIAFYNCEEALDEDWIEERWFRQSERLKERPRKTWKDNDIAERVFNSIEPKEPKIYSCIIRAMAKFYQVDKAYLHFNTCMDNNIPLDVGAYNAILNVCGNLKESNDLRWKLIQDILMLMKERNVDPNLATMNACLYVISQMGPRDGKNYALQIVAEFKKIGIEPSLGSYSLLINTFCQDRNQVSHILHDIMNHIEGKEFEIKDIRDTHFFVTAMENCRHHLFDANLAKRVNALLHHGENYNLIGDSYKESAYYRSYFSVLALNEPLDVFMNEHYHYLVPHVYIPEPSVMEDILKMIESNGAIEHVPLMWSNIVSFDQIGRENLLNIIVRILMTAKVEGEQAIVKFNEESSRIGWDIWTRIEEKNEMRSKPFVWTGKLLGDLLRLVLRSQDLDKATHILEKLMKNQQKILGEPDFEGMEEYVQLCITKKQPTKAIQCLQYCTELMHNESARLAKTICSGFTLDENHTKKISYLVGSNVLRDIEMEIEKEQEERMKENMNKLN